MDDAMSRLYKGELARLMGTNGKALLEAATNPLLLKAGGFPLPLFGGMEDGANPFSRGPPADIQQVYSIQYPTKLFWFSYLMKRSYMFGF